MDAVEKCETCGMQYGAHDRACIAEQLHKQKLKIVKRLAAWKTQYEVPFPGPIDLNQLSLAVVESAIKMVQEA